MATPTSLSFLLLLKVAVGIQINSDHIEMYADWTSKDVWLDDDALFKWKKNPAN
ncbi:hypothetical protein DEO72_LG10g1493 [Vigna unguiculata]|uniref:Uncharacterized protein n=1 Tax=Vigna unguiculata TaxID=3917 RepID=A0A4D6NDP3_VIGUN|nr:hypothetical protein DEO72_LG10g1493 [Vigna unguiculata]